jgi:hypothetical protein
VSATRALPTWVAVSVDDGVLGDDEGAWPEVAAELDTLASLAEQEGARLGFRFREAFPRLDTHGFVRSLVARGHEAGWTAPGLRLREARDAVVAAGGTARAGAPGLTRAAWTGRPGLLEEAQDLGATLVTDVEALSRFPWAGWLARWIAPGLLAMDVSVDGRTPSLSDPRTWGAARLAQARWAVPDGTAAFFGVLVDHGRLASPQAQEALRAFLAACAGEVRAPLAIAETLAGMALPAPRPPVLRLRAPSLAGIAAGAGRLGDGPRRMVSGAMRRWGLAPEPTHGLAVGTRTVGARRAGPDHPAAAVVVVGGHDDGILEGLRFLGASEAALPDLATWTWTRSPGSFRAVGNPVHVADLVAVLEAARADGVPVGILAHGAGLVDALLAAARLERDAVRFIVDCEGPTDRGALAALAASPRPASLYDDDAWRTQEPVRLLPRFAGRYLRLQGNPDHVLGAMDVHARRVADLGERWDVRGALQDHGVTLLPRLQRWMLDAAQG